MAERKVLLVRIRPALYGALRRWAAEEFRSMNGQIEFLLHEALRQSGRLPRRGASDQEAGPERPGRKGGPGRPRPAQASGPEPGFSPRAEEGRTPDASAADSPPERRREGD